LRCEIHELGSELATPRRGRLKVPCIRGERYSVRVDNGAPPILPISACRLALRRASGCKAVGSLPTKSRALSLR
jgi:hypothetical protein